MKQFTFVTITFNHQDTILTHLESIKKLITKYAKKIAVSYVISDDCSRDRTVEIAKEWLEQNSKLFDKITVLSKQKNQGTVINYISAINAVDTEDFKLLAGDDYYGDENIFELFSQMNDNEIVITPVTPYGNTESSICDYLASNYRIVMHAAKKGRVANLMQVEYLIQAPGVFVKKSTLTESGVLEYISCYKFIEDYPMYYYLIVKKGYPTTVLNKSYVYYQVGGGISTNKKKKNVEYENDLLEIRKTIKSRNHMLPKLINPYRYYLKIIRKYCDNSKDVYKIDFLKQ